MSNEISISDPRQTARHTDTDSQTEQFPNLCQFQDEKQKCTEKFMAVWDEETDDNEDKDIEHVLEGRNHKNAGYCTETYVS